MLKDHILLVIAPLLAAALIFGVVYVNPNIASLSALSTLSKNLNFYESYSCTECPSFVTAADCTNTAYPVLGGLDMVQYFTEFKNSDGTYDETKVGTVGSKDYSSVYNGYTFYFKSSENKALFDHSPTSYLPQYGGFCSWGVAGELCPDKPWTGSCLGPSGNWAHWTIQNDKLYFFLFDNAKANFLADSVSYADAGDYRWSDWFPQTDAYFSTRCYVSSSQDGKTRDVGTSIHTPKGAPL